MPESHDRSRTAYAFSVSREMRADAASLYSAWTQDMDSWFAAPGSVLMTPQVGIPFFFETEFNGGRHPHYGRFLELIPDRLIKLTWVTGEPGTRGAETVITIELEAGKEGTALKLTHAGFADEQTAIGHESAWPGALEILDNALAHVPDEPQDSQT